jgi:hypothetical protein
MQAAKPGKQSVAGMGIPALLIALPALLFYGILFRQLVDLPLMDDYYALLRFLNQAVQQREAAAKFWFFLAAQHNEYKLFLVHALAWAQFALLGHVNFAQLSVLGNSAVLALALVLWRMFLPGLQDAARRLALFVPAAWLLFQLEYWETLDWAMASLQNLWVIAFSLWAICCLLRPSRRAYAGALVLYTLAVATLANGFLLLPVGILILLARRQLARVAGWLVASAVCTAAYAFHYNVMSSQSTSHGSVFSALPHLRPDYAIAFAGNAGAIAGPSPISAGICLTLGTVLLLLFGWLARRGYARRNPAVAYSVLFLLLTALGVAGLRSDFGLIQSLAPRYTIYGALLLIFEWTAFAEEFLQHRDEPLLSNGPYLAVALAAVVFSLCTDRIGALDLAWRGHEAIKGMAAFEHPARPGATDGPVLRYDWDNEFLATLRQQARGILNESIRLGVYEPPKF